MIAAKKGHKEVVEAILEYEKGMSDNQSHNALYHALKSGHTEAAKIVMPHEDPTDGDGVTALMRAAARGDAEMVKLLIPIQKGAKDKDRGTAFFHALETKHEGIALLLIEHESRSLPEKCLVQSNLAEPDRPVPATSQSPSSCQVRQASERPPSSVGPSTAWGLTASQRPPRRSAGYSGRCR